MLFRVVTFARSRHSRPFIPVVPIIITAAIVVAVIIITAVIVLIIVILIGLIHSLFMTTANANVIFSFLVTPT